MKRLAIAISAVIALGVAIAYAQTFTMPPPAGVTVMGCVYNSSPPTLTTGQAGMVQCSSTGALATSGGGGSTSVTIDQTTPGTTNGVTTKPWVSTTTQVAVAPVTPTFSTVLAASATRRHCLIQNRGTTEGLIYFGANGSASAANAFSVPAGGSIMCGANGVVATENVSGTCVSGTCAFIVSSQ